MDDLDEFRLSLIRDNKPLTADALVSFWLRRNKDAIIKCAYAILQEPAGQEFRIVPLTFTAFTDERAKLLYQELIYTAAEQAVRKQNIPAGRERNKALAHARIRLHVNRFTTFLKERMTARLVETIDDAVTYHSLTDEMPTPEDA